MNPINAIALLQHHKCDRTLPNIINAIALIHKPNKCDRTSTTSQMRSHLKNKLQN
ncbi:MAG: hypothetical protein ICV78_16725 [Tolypothrix sp. Co-bin9]|nr:hypothetical protein [Tolypothrix sp. Co-bin9]